MRGKAPLQLRPAGRGKMQQNRSFFGDAVPDLLDELDSLGDGKLFEVGNGRIHVSGIHQPLLRLGADAARFSRRVALRFMAIDKKWPP